MTPPLTLWRVSFCVTFAGRSDARVVAPDAATAISRALSIPAVKRARITGRDVVAVESEGAIDA